MTRIGLEDMEFYAFHGFYAAEQKMGGKYLLTVFTTLSADLQPSEEIDETVNYEMIYKICSDEMNIPRKLLETVVWNIADRLKKRFSIIEKVDVTLRKVGVQVGGKVSQSVIEYSN